MVQKGRSERTLAFIGVGNMGGPMARHLLAANHRLVAFDLREEVLQTLREAGGETARDAAEAVRQAEVVFLSLPTPGDVLDVVTSIENTVPEGAILVDTTTSTPETTRTISERLGKRGVRVLGAPVSGGRTGAEAGELSTMVGGDADALEECRPLLECFAADIVHVGEQPEHGHAVKLLNNYLSTTGLLATSEAVNLGQKAGIPMETLLEVFNASSGRNSATLEKFPRHVVTKGYDMGFPMRLMDKDLRLVTEFGEDHDVPLLLASVVRQLVGYARSRLGDQADMTEVYRFFKEIMTRPKD